jgi:hypothetical protein
VVELAKNKLPPESDIAWALVYAGFVPRNRGDSKFVHLVEFGQPAYSYFVNVQL